MAHKSPDLIRPLDTSEIRPLDQDIREMAMLASILRAGIPLAVKHGLIETEHDLRRALLALQLEMPEAVALSVKVEAQVGWLS